MFGMGFSEILMIALVAILFLGPEKLPDAMVKIAKFLNSFRQTVNEAKSTFEEELHIKELKEEALSYRQTLQSASEDISGFKNAMSKPTQELEEAIAFARSGMPSNKLNSEIDLLDDDEEPSSNRPAVTDYKEMAKKRLAENEKSQNLDKVDEEKIEESSGESSPSRPSSFKNLKQESEA